MAAINEQITLSRKIKDKLYVDEAYFCVRRHIEKILKNIDPVGVKLAKINQLLKAEKLPLRVDLWSKKEVRGRIWNPLLIRSHAVAIREIEKERYDEYTTIREEAQFLLAMSGVIYEKTLNEICDEIDESAQKAHARMALVLSKMMGFELYETKDWKKLPVHEIALGRVTEEAFTAVIKNMLAIGKFKALKERLKEDSEQWYALKDILPSISPIEESRLAFLEQFWDAMYERFGRRC